MNLLCILKYNVKKSQCFEKVHNLFDKLSFKKMGCGMFNVQRTVSPSRMDLFNLLIQVTPWQLVMHHGFGFPIIWLLPIFGCRQELGNNQPMDRAPSFYTLQLIYLTQIRGCLAFIQSIITLTLWIILIKLIFLRWQYIRRSQIKGTDCQRQAHLEPMGTRDCTETVKEV